ncbi:MAG TPA: DUF4910 domain-containing protein [Armatimonadota bacterium]|nr:DUF4910 domain-containing protein [Armatimonadota bacterium]
MLESILDLVGGAFDPESALRYVERLVQWNRLPTTSDYARSAAWSAALLREWGLEVSTHSFPTDGARMYWSYVTPPRWECRSGWLELQESGERVADARVQPLSVIQRSVSTPGVVEAELVVVENGDDPEAYPADLRGKIILTDASAEHAAEYGIRRRGAAGLVLDAMPSWPRPAGDLPDALQWSLFPYTRGRPLEGWGFVVSPGVGQRLRRRCAEGSVRVRAFIDAEHGTGSLEGVSALLSGESSREIWLVAHLCHPAPFAHDNASGAAVLLEIARGLSHLVNTGAAPRLKRGIRFLLPVEISGTIAYLAENPELSTRGIAGLNLDMVGGNQEKTGGVLCIDRPPDSCPSCLPELLEEIYAAGPGQFTGLSGNSRYPLFRHTTTDFSAGSDHWPLNDPSVGIPTPMLIEWPDRFYHTSADVLENLDPDTLRRNGVAAAAYALFLATAGADEVEWLLARSVGRFAGRLGQLLGRGRMSALPPSRSLRYRVERQKECLTWLDTLRDAPVEREGLSEGAATLERVARALGASDELFETLPDRGADPIWRMRLEIVYPGPISHFAHVGVLPDEEREAFRRLSAAHPRAARNYSRRITHWANGQRSVADVSDMVELEMGERDDTFLPAYLRVLERLGLVRLREPL